MWPFCNIRPNLTFMTLAMFRYVHNRPASAFAQRTSCIFLPRAKADLILSCQASETATPQCCIRLVAEACCSLLVHLQIFISNNLDQIPKRHPGLAAMDSIPFFHPQRQMIHEWWKATRAVLSPGLYHSNSGSVLQLDNQISFHLNFYKIGGDRHRW